MGGPDLQVSAGPGIFRASIRRTEESTNEQQYPIGLAHGWHERTFHPSADVFADAILVAPPHDGVLLRATDEHHKATKPQVREGFEGARRSSGTKWHARPLQSVRGDRRTR